MGNAVKQIEVTIEQCKEVVERGKTLERLLDHPDFTSLIMNDYMKREAHRQTLLLSDPALDSKEQRAATVRGLQAIADLNAYFRTVRTAGVVAERTMKEHQEELEFELQREIEEE